MQTESARGASAHGEAGSVVGLFRYPVKSMMGEELNAAEVTERGLVGDRRFAVVDPSTGKVAGAKNPRKWGNFFDFRATYVEPPRRDSELPDVRLTLPDGTAVTSAEPELARILSNALGREVAFAEAKVDESPEGATAEEYWPDMEGLDFRDTVTDFDLPAGTFFDLAVVHLLTTATIDRLREHGIEASSGRGLDFYDPWGNQSQVVDYRDVQFTKTPEVLRALGLEGLEKSESAKEELRAKGIST